MTADKYHGGVPTDRLRKDSAIAPVTALPSDREISRIEEFFVHLIREFGQFFWTVGHLAFLPDRWRARIARRQALRLLNRRCGGEHWYADIGMAHISAIARSSGAMMMADTPVPGYTSIANPTGAFQNPSQAPGYQDQETLVPIGEGNGLAKGFFTVSPTGIATGGATYNNGADYGPDTPHTTTSGVQECLTALQPMGGKGYLLTGAFQVNSTLTYTSNYPMTLDGEVRGRLEQAGNGATNLGTNLALGVILLVNNLAATQVSLQITSTNYNLGLVKITNVDFRGQPLGLPFNVNVSTSSTTWTWASGSGAASLITSQLVGWTIYGSGIAANTTISSVVPGVSITVNQVGSVAGVTQAAMYANAAATMYGISFDGVGDAPSQVSLDNVAFEFLTNPLYINNPGDGPVDIGLLEMVFCSWANANGAMAIINTATCDIKHIEAFSCNGAILGIESGEGACYMNIGSIYTSGGTRIVNFGCANSSVPPTYLHIGQLIVADNSSNYFVRVLSSGTGQLSCVVDHVVWGSGLSVVSNGQIIEGTGLSSSGSIQVTFNNFVGCPHNWIENNGSSPSFGANSFVRVLSATLTAAPSADTPITNCVTDIRESGSSYMQKSLNGTTAGTAASNFDAYTVTDKRFKVYLNGYENTTGVAQTITFPYPFTHAPAIIHDDSGGASVNATTLTLPASMGTAKTGLILVEGY